MTEATSSSTPPPAFSKSEMMIVAAARELAGQHVCFVGVGLPNIAVNLAKRTVTPDLELVYEAGVFATWSRASSRGSKPRRAPSMRRVVSAISDEESTVKGDGRWRAMHLIVFCCE